MIEAAAWACAYNSAITAQNYRRLEGSYVIKLNGGEIERSTLSRNPQTKGKCPCCGSRNFMKHKDKMICTYCRSSQA